MAKILFVGDPHIQINHFETGKAFLTWINELALDLKPDMFINLGDFFHTHAVVRSEVMSEYKKHVNTILSADIPYYHILGNHEFFRPNSSRYHALQGLKGFHPNYHVIDERTDLDGITMIPFIPDKKDFPLDTKEILIAHQTFIGADYGFKKETDAVDSDAVTANIIISGHIHKRQRYGKVVYPGTPYAHGLSDVNQQKGVLLFDTDDYSSEFILCPLPMWKRFDHTISGEQPTGDLHDSLVRTLNDTDHWTLDIHGPKAEMVSYFKSKKFIDLKKGKKVVVKTTPTDKIKKKTIIKSSSTPDMVREYVLNIYSGQLDKSLIIQKAEELLKQVEQV